MSKNQEERHNRISDYLSIVLTMQYLDKPLMCPKNVVSRQMYQYN